MTDHPPLHPRQPDRLPMDGSTKARRLFASAMVREIVRGLQALGVEPTTLRCHPTAAPLLRAVALELGLTLVAASDAPLDQLHVL